LNVTKELSYSDLKPCLANVIDLVIYTFPIYSWNHLCF